MTSQEIMDILKRVGDLKDDIDRLVMRNQGLESRCEIFHDELTDLVKKQHLCREAFYKIMKECREGQMVRAEIHEIASRALRALEENNEGDTRSPDGDRPSENQAAAASG